MGLQVHVHETDFSHADWEESFEYKWTFNKDRPRNVPESNDLVI